MIVHNNNLGGSSSDDDNENDVGDEIYRIMSFDDFIKKYDIIDKASFLSKNFKFINKSQLQNKYELILLVNFQNDIPAYLNDIQYEFRLKFNNKEKSNLYSYLMRLNVQNKNILIVNNNRVIQSAFIKNTLKVKLNIGNGQIFMFNS